MGIRFHCPNGHKLNVKEFQAGRKGICPFCGAKIQIPTQSTRPSSKRTHEKHGQVDPTTEGDEEVVIVERPPIPTIASAASGGAANRPANPEVAVAPPVFAPRMSAGPQAAVPAPAAPTAPVPAPVAAAPIVAPVPMAAPAGPAAGPVVSGPSPVAPSGTPGPAPSAPAPAAGPAPVPALADPIAEAPEMIWYVRPPSGGQFGPAAGDIMRSWLAEGRVSADSLVWREGWRDWQEAGEVFPQLRADPAAAFFGAVANETVSVTTPARRAKLRHPSKSNQAAVIALLVVVVALLSAILLWLAFRP